MFRRTKTQTAPESAETAAVHERSGGKGRPTPSRREAETAARERAKAARNPSRAKGSTRMVRAENARDIRAKMKAGDERYLLPRDQGPHRRFIRDFVDSRLNMAEFAMPLLLASLLLSTAGYANVGSGLMNAILLVVVLDTVLLRFRLRRKLKERFGVEALKGSTFYAFTRALQMRFMRLPKPQVRIGQPLPDRY